METSAAGLEKAIKAIKIGLSLPEQDHLHRELEELLGWLEPLLAFNTGETEPLLFGHEAVNVLREDHPQEGRLAELQEAAPNFAGGFYLVPKIMD